MCGIFGIINHHKRLLDKRAFITLGCVNDSRGGDACGIMIDRVIDKGTKGSDQYFQCWYPKSELLKNTEKCYVALGHCRKASVGGVAPEKAQPIAIYDKEGKMLFCLIHNGTIYNYKKLAEKYIPGINITDLTDSQVMAYIFYYRGYEVLEEYEGGGAFVMHDYRVNKTFLFKGESLKTPNAVKTEVERPLYFVKTGKSVIFSSIFAALQGLYWGFDAYDVPSNVLLECDGLNIYKVQEYDRTKCKGYQSYSAYSLGTTSKDMYSTPGTNYYTKTSTVEVDVEFGTYINPDTGGDLHGSAFISNYGFISKYKTVFNDEYYFWKGIMLSGKNAFNALQDLEAEGAPFNVVMNAARRLSCNPVVINKKYYTYSADNKRVCYTDTYAFPVTKTEILCNNHGKMTAFWNNYAREEFVPIELSEEKCKSIIDYVKKNGIQ